MRRPKLKVLDQEDVQKIIEAAYDLLENFGVKIDNQEALEILADRGAKVDLKERVSLNQSQESDTSGGESEHSLG